FAAGILYGAGTVSLLAGGRKDQSDIQIRDISKKMAAHFRDLDLKLPEDCSLTAITEDHKKGVIKNADDLFRRYPSELMNMFFAAAGACIAISAYKALKHPVPSKSLEEVYSRLAPKGFAKATVEKNMQFYHKVESMLDIGLGAMTSLSGLFVLSVK